MYQYSSSPLFLYCSANKFNCFFKSCYNCRKPDCYTHYSIHQDPFANRTIPNHYFHNSKSAYTYPNEHRYALQHYVRHPIRNNVNTRIYASHPVFSLPILAICFFPACQQEFLHEPHPSVISGT